MGSKNGKHIYLNLVPKVKKCEVTPTTPTHLQCTVHKQTSK